jgi:uncharacterized delta-60 repeat protein
MAGVLVGVLVAATGLGASAAGAWPGDPDGTWGSCGLKSIDITRDRASAATSILLDADGNYVVGGFVGSRALVAKFFAGGALDATFGAGGTTTLGLGSDASFAAIARQTDGKTVAVGARTSDGSVDSVIARVTTSGQLDPGFHATGSLVSDYGGSDRLTAVQVQLNGAIVVGGTSGSQGLVARVSTTGVPDPSFNGDGERTNLPMTVQGLVLQPDGKIVVGGRSSSDDFALMRLNSDGSTDSSFGGADGVQTDLGGYDVATAIALEADGKVIAVGSGHGASGAGHTIVRRYNADGTVDAGFQEMDQAFGLDDQPVAVVVRSDGKIVLAANSKVHNDNDVLLVRLNSDGTNDDTFGIGGVSLADAGSYPVVGDVALRSDGRAIVAGSLRVSGRQRLALLRYQGDTATAARPAQGFVLDGSGGLHGFSAGCSSKPAAAAGNAKWPSRDVARGVALLPGGRGFVVDGSGALHAFHFGDGVAATATGNTRWPGQDIARGIAIVPEGTGGYVVDRSGGLHAFRIGSGTRPKIPANLVKWPGRDYARGIALLPNGDGGYVLDADGGLHPFGGAPAAHAGAPSWPGQNRARGVTIAPDGSGGWVLDSLGGLYPFGIGANPKPKPAVGGPTWPGPTARGVAALP